MIWQGTNGISRGMQVQPFAASDGILALQDHFWPAKCTLMYFLRHLTLLASLHLFDASLGSEGQTWMTDSAVVI